MSICATLDLSTCHTLGMKNVWCLFLIGIFVVQTSWAEIDLKRPPKSFEIGAFSHSVSLPFKASNTLLSFQRPPGLRLGVGRAFGKTPKRLGLGYKAAFSAYHQKELHYGYELAGQLEGYFLLNHTLSFYTDVGLGYLHVFDDRPKYAAKTGQLAQRRDWGRPQATAQLGVGMRCRVANHLSLTASYHQILQLPFAPRAGVFMIPHTRIHFGLRYSKSA